jgi:hypothetical protein
VPDGLAEILQQAEAIGHLSGLLGAVACALDIEATPIAADDLGAGMLAQPPSA